MDETEVHQGVLVHGVTVQGDAVHVDLYGGGSNLCGTVCFVFTHPRRRRAMTAVLRRWARRNTPLTMVTEGSSITLQDERTTFGADLVG